MELEFDRDTMTCYETVAEVTLCQEETLESIVPDACPDIQRIVDVCGQAFLSGKQAKEGVAAVSGMVRAVILYQPEGAAGLRRMEVGLPFTCQVDAPGLTDRGTVLACPRLRCADARALNPRKVLLRVDLAVEVIACQPVERPICRGVLETEGAALCQRQYSGETYQITSVQEKPFTFSEEIRLPQGQGGEPQLLSFHAQPQCNECRLIGSKLIFKGTAELYLLLQEEGGLSTVHESLPFSQVLEVTGVGEDGDCQIWVELTDLQCEARPGESRNLEVVMDLLAQARVHCRRPVTLLQDLYSTRWQTEVDSQLLPLCRVGEQGIRPQTVRELLETGELVRSVADSRLTLGQLTQSREGSQLVLTAEAWVTVLYFDENELVQRVERSIPVSCRLDCPEGFRCSCTCRSSGEVFAAPSAGGVEVRFPLEFHYLTTSVTPIPFVENAHFGEARASGEGTRPSIVLRLAAPGEGVWEIAKTYGTTVGQILQANELEEEELPDGKMLLIPSAR